MRRPLHLSRAPRREQGGFALFIVLIMMIVIAFLVVAATQSYNTEMRIGSNDADRKMAMATAEAALRQGFCIWLDQKNPAEQRRPDRNEHNKENDL